MTPARPQTTPHDYRVIFERQPAPTVVGGQAVNLWAINYLTHVVPKETLVSKDLDVVASKEALANLKEIPGWIFQPRQTRNWMDSRLGALRSVTPDGRPLLVEILHSVHGLDKSDLEAAAYLESAGVVYRVLDPVAMLKAKAANVRDIDQVGPPLRQDRAHLQLVARCVPEFLHDVHRNATADGAREKEALSVVSRAFKTLQNAKTAETLRAEGIVPSSLIPAEFKESPLLRIRRACVWQFPRLEPATEKLRMPDSVTSVNQPAPRPSQGPRMGM